ncbi:MAG TPA: LptA/OstA family protein, partial [Alphaproteobacteria bacterium]|nr:LptA/OstA family protein [Alphaproteobacteria bacterium]
MTGTASAQEAQPEVFQPASAAQDAPAKNGGGPLSMLGSKGEKDQYLDITADQSLEWHEDESVYIARGHAKAKRGNTTITADLLKAYNRKKPDGSSEVWKMTAEGNVHIIDGQHEVTGDKGEYDIDTHKATLTGENLRFTAGSDVVTAREAFVYDEAGSKITARGGATAVREGRQVQANEMVAYLAPNKTGGQDIDRMEAKGDVRIVTKEDAALCDNAVYNLAKNNATLSGHVRLTRGQNQLYGDKVEADFKTGRSRLINTGSGRVSALIIGSKGKPG